MSRIFYVKLENILTSLNTYQVITVNIYNDTVKTIDLIQQIKHHYSFPDIDKIRLELWSGPIGSKRIRLDLFEDIPDKYDNIWVRGYLLIDNKTNNQIDNAEFTKA
jgi:hypothetical protein